MILQGEGAGSYCSISLAPFPNSDLLNDEEEVSNKALGRLRVDIDKL